MKRALNADDKTTPRENVNSDSEEDSDSDAYTLDELGELYESADAVLGGSDPDNCSWTKGYVKRQALYACLTCNGPNSANSQQAGICLACSNKCHEDHKLIELYTKRNFRCDCGNMKFQTPCLLQSDKDPSNDGNLYNQNFDGVYCTCKRPYPDPDNLDSDDEMAQCVICEDWFHGQHSLGQKWSSIVPADPADGSIENEMIDHEMVCASCTSGCDFLEHYSHLTVAFSHVEENKEKKDLVKVDAEEQSESPAIKGSEDEKTNELKAEIDIESRCDASASPSTDTFCSSVPVNDEVLSGSSSHGTVDSGIMSDAENKSSSNKNDCLLNSLPRVAFPKRAILLQSGWRTKLCKCEKCLNLYAKIGVSFVIDEKDTLHAYEAIGKERIEKEEQQKEEAFTNMWSKLDHVAQIEAMIGINEMKEQLKEFMLQHDGKVIRRRDVEAFFSDLKAKRPRFGSGHGIPPSNCR